MTPTQFYTDQLSIHQALLASVSSRQKILRIARFVTFLLIASGTYIFWGEWLQFAASLLLGSIAFGFLVFKSSDLKEKRIYLEALIVINQTEIDALGGDWYRLDTGDEFKNDDHAFAQDLDLFGRASFFQWLNRSVLAQGKVRVAKLLTSNDSEQVLEKQQAIQELAQKATWRQGFSATGRLIQTKVTEKTVIKWFANYDAIAPSYAPILVAGMSALSLLAIGLVVFDLIPSSWLIYVFLLGGGLLGKYLKLIAKLSDDTGRIQDLFERYHGLLHRIETESFSSKSLVALQARIHEPDRKASEIFKEFSKLLGALDQRNNILFSIPANGFFLRDLWVVRKIDKWIDLHGSKVEEWFDVISEFDALNSFANFAFNHPDYVYPELLEGGTQLEAVQLGHPLLKREGRIDNDFKMLNQQFFIITGANMAGKSTFLRTVGLSVVMANCGLPVCAKTFRYSPIKLITSMRTTDSLSENESYFFSELKRLKRIIDTIEHEEHFIILDEILKGTNSMDKAKGSQQFVEKLVRTKSTGIIATHDLSLCELEAQLPEVSNYYFDAEIVNDELYFDYSLKNGVCQNMNASFLLKKMGIV